mgnify:CR=1 FL=1
MKKKHVYVILKNKIIGTDSVITLCMQIYKECGYTFTFILFEHGSFKAIKNDNIVLFDAINSIGKLVSLSSERYKYRVISKIFTVLFFIKMILKIKFQENYIMHSGGLHVKPLSFIMNFTPLQRIIFHETSSYGRLCHENKGVDTPEMFFSRRQTQNAFDSNVLRHLLPTLNAGILIAYDEFWNYFKHPEAINAQQVVFNNSRNAGAWIDFIKNRSSEYIDSELDKYLLNQKSKHILIIFIGRIQIDKSGSYIKSFIQMIDEISKTVGDKVPVFIKPHIFADLEFIMNCISKGVGGGKINYIFTKLHPSVLASRAAISFFIGNSTVINEISNLNVPIIQCLYGFDDKGILAKTSKKSDYVITKKTDNLGVIINDLLSVDNPPAVYRKKQGKFNCGNLFN